MLLGVTKMTGRNSKGNGRELRRWLESHVESLQARCDCNDASFAFSMSWPDFEQLPGCVANSFHVLISVQALAVVALHYT